MRSFEFFILKGVINQPNWLYYQPSPQRHKINAYGALHNQDNGVWIIDSILLRNEQQFKRNLLQMQKIRIMFELLLSVLFTNYVFKLIVSQVMNKKLSNDPSPADKAQHAKKQFDQDLWYMSFLFNQEVRWWFCPKNIQIEKKLIKKICANHGIVLKLFRCKLAHGSICYLIIIDGYIQVGSNIDKAMTQLLTLFDPIVPIQGFKLKEILVFNPYGSFDYSFDDSDIECMICLDVKSMQNKQSCCGKPICEKCRESQKQQTCFYCKQKILLRDYLSTEEYQKYKSKITEKQEGVRKNGKYK